MKWFRQTIEQHRVTFLLLLAVNVFFMVDGTSYVYAHELKRQEQELFLRGFSRTLGVPIERMHPDRLSMFDRLGELTADRLAPWAASGTSRLEKLIKEYLEQFDSVGEKDQYLGFRVCRLGPEH